MDHVAILNKSWKLIPKIISGEKAIESRWYLNKTAPWNKVKEGDVIYFKDAGMSVEAKAEVAQIVQYEKYDAVTLNKIIDDYYGKGGICFVASKEEVLDWASGKKYCILIFLKNPQKVEPFEINKLGFGNACAWLCVNDINKVKMPR